MKNFKILDCTLRDGGYYTNWDFKPQTVDKYLKAMEELPIDYIEIGTIINIHPKIIDDYMSSEGEKAVQLNVSLVVSSEIGKQVIDRKQFPVISSRTYNYTVIVPTGRTLAIGGLSESQETNIEKKIPILGDVPIIGAVFRNKSEVKKKRNLVAFITPTILG